MFTRAYDSLVRSSYEGAMLGGVAVLLQAGGLSASVGNMVSGLPVISGLAPNVQGYVATFSIIFVVNAVYDLINTFTQA